MAFFSDVDEMLKYLSRIMSGRGYYQLTNDTKETLIKDDFPQHIHRKA